MSWRARAAAARAGAVEPWVALTRAATVDDATARLVEVVDYALGNSGGAALRSDQALSLVKCVAQAATAHMDRAVAAHPAPVPTSVLCMWKLAADAIVAVTQSHDVHVPTRAVGDVFPFLLRAARLRIAEAGADDGAAFRQAIAAAVRLHALRALGNLVYVNAERVMGGAVGMGLVQVCTAHCGAGQAAEDASDGVALHVDDASADLADDDDGRGDGARAAGEGVWFRAPFDHFGSLHGATAPAAGGFSGGPASVPAQELTSATILLGTALTRAGPRNLPAALDKAATAAVVATLCAHVVDTVPAGSVADVERWGRLVSASFRLLHALLLCWAADPLLQDWLAGRGGGAVGGAGGAAARGGPRRGAGGAAGGWDSALLPRVLHKGMVWGRSGDGNAAATSVTNAARPAAAGGALVRAAPPAAASALGAAWVGMAAGAGSSASSWYSYSDDEGDDDAAAAEGGGGAMSWRHGSSVGGRDVASVGAGSGGMGGGGTVAHGDDGLWWEISAHLGKIGAADMVPWDSASVSSAVSAGPGPGLGMGMGMGRGRVSTPGGGAGAEVGGHRGAPTSPASPAFPSAPGVGGGLAFRTAPALGTPPPQPPAAAASGAAGDDEHRSVRSGRSGKGARKPAMPSRVKVAIRARVTALHAITLLARSFPRALLARWTLFVPEVQGTHPAPWAPSLTTVLLYDTSHRVREAAAQALGTLMRAVPWDRWLPAAPGGGVAGGSGGGGGGGGGGGAASTGALAGSGIGDKAAAAVQEVHFALCRALQAYLPPTAAARGSTPASATDAGAPVVPPAWEVTKPSVVAAILQCVSDVTGAVPYTRVGAPPSAAPPPGRTATTPPRHAAKAASAAGVASRQAMIRSHTVKALEQLAHGVSVCLAGSHQHVAVSALHAVGAMLGSESVVALLTAVSGGGAVAGGEHAAAALRTPALMLQSVTRCALRHVGTAAAAAMRSEALSVLLRGAKVCTGAFVAAWRAGGPRAVAPELARAEAPPMPQLIATSLADAAPNVRAAALRLMEELLTLRGRVGGVAELRDRDDTPAGGAGEERDGTHVDGLGAATGLGGADDGAGDDGAPAAGSAGTVAQPDCLAVWECLVGAGFLPRAAGGAVPHDDFFPAALQRSLRDPHAPVRANAVACLTAVCADDWAVVLAADGGAAGAALLDSVGGLLEDANATVRGNVCRMLGQYAGNAMWRSPGFCMWAAAILLVALGGDDSVAVRAKAAWAVGNLVSPPNSAPARTLAAALLGERDAGALAAGMAPSPADAPHVAWLLESGFDGQLPRRLPPASRAGVAAATFVPSPPVGSDGGDPTAPCSLFRADMSQSALVNALGLPAVRQVTAALLSCVARDVDKVAGPAVRALGFCLQALVLHWLPLPAHLRDTADPVVTSEVELDPADPAYGSAVAAAGSHASLDAPRVLVRRPLPQACPDDGLIAAGAQQLAHCIAAGQSLPAGLLSAHRSLAVATSDGAGGSLVEAAAHGGGSDKPPAPAHALSGRAGASPPRAAAPAVRAAGGGAGAEATKTRWNACHAVCLLLPLAHRMATTHVPASTAAGGSQAGGGAAGETAEDGRAALALGDPAPSAGATSGSGDVGRGDAFPLHPGGWAELPSAGTGADAPPSPLHPSLVSSLRHAATVAGLQPGLVHSPPRPRVRKETTSGAALALAGVDHVSTALSPFVPKVRRVPRSAANIALSGSPGVLPDISPAPPPPPAAPSPVAAAAALRVIVRTITDCTLPSVRIGTAWLPDVLAALQTAMAAAHNVKVRIAATYALALMPSRQAFRTPVDAFPPCLATALSLWRSQATAASPAPTAGGDAGEACSPPPPPAALMGPVPSALRVACLHLLQLAERSDYGRMKPVLEDAAAFICGWLEGELVAAGGTLPPPLLPDAASAPSLPVPGGAPADGAGGGGTPVPAVPVPPLPDVSLHSVVRCMAVLAGMFASRVKTIPAPLLRRYQAHVVASAAGAGGI